MDVILLITPLARGAYFADMLKIAEVEISSVPDVEMHAIEENEGLAFAQLSAPESALPALARLSVTQALFQAQNGAWRPLSISAEFGLHADFVSGEKYRGKTSEVLTQLALNLALATQQSAEGPLRLLDPMCGRGTTLFWAMRYGISAVGVEQDPAALNEVQRGLKKWTKLHRQKHKLSEGWVQKSSKSGVGKFLEFSANGQTAKIVTGDTGDVRKLLGQRPFDLIVTDIPYGVQHMGGAGHRNPQALIETVAPVWSQALAPGGAMAIAYNSYMPKRAAMEAAFEGLGLELVTLDVAHRMSESIVRDILVLRKPN